MAKTLYLEMNPNKFIESIEIIGNAEHIFDYTQDYTNRLTWDRFLAKAELLGNHTIPSKGAKAWCVARNGVGMETEYVSYNRPKVTAIKMTKGPFLFKEFAGSWNFIEAHPGITTVTFLYTFKTRFPFILFDHIIKYVLRRNVRKRLLDLKRNVESIDGANLK